MEPIERVKTAALSMTNVLKVQLLGDGEKPIETVVDLDIVQTLINDWNVMSKKAATSTIEQYGPPNEALQSRLIWYNNGPWKRTIVFRDQIQHDFPQPHTDVIENVVNYRVPIDMFSELAKFDGSIIVERTKGEVSSRCDMEAANIIALNLMNDIVTGKITAEKAREVCCEVTSAFMMNRPAPYAELLQFVVTTDNTKDTDKVQIAGAMVNQAFEKVNELVEQGKSDIRH